MQVPKVDIIDYSNSVVAELYAPLEASYRGDLDGDPNAIALLLLCETTLAAFHNVSAKDMPYKLLKSYGIAPLKSGAMARAKHLTLRHCARLSPTGILRVPRTLVDRVFLAQSAVELVPRSARREMFMVLDFLGKVKANNRRDMVAKAASVLVEQMVEEFVCTNVVARRAVLNSSVALHKSGCIVHSVVSARTYATRAFDIVSIPRDSRVYGFLRVALDMMSEGDLYPRIATELLRKCTFVPRVVVHGPTLNVAATMFQVLAPSSFSSVKNQVRDTIMHRF